MYLNNSQVVDIVNKKRYPSPLRAIFYDLALKGNGGPPAMIFFLTIVGFVFFFSLQITTSMSTRCLGLMLSLLVFMMPFVLAVISYYSKLIFQDGNYELKFLGITFPKGHIDDLLELHKLSIFNGCYRVKTKGYSEVSGFLLHWDEVPEPLKHLPCICDNDRNEYE